jgi:hypothetical protein
MALSPNPGYSKDGKFVGTEKGAYDHKGRKIGYDDDDMKNGISDTNTNYQDPRYLAREDEHIKMHPAVNPEAGITHPGGSNPGASQLLNTHGGVRNENAIRTDIRHGWNILQQRHPKGVEGGLPHWHAEEVGYNARKHIYIQAEQAAAKKAAPVDNTAARSQQFMQSMQAKDSAPGGVFHEYSKPTPPAGNPTEWDSEPSAPARTPAPKAKSSKPKPYRDPNDTIGGAIKHVIGKLREKH